ncbi:MAG: GNAT family N-acetyltransferase, partial [Bifidobacteriaceae bacterium]|nr:GNAT family N-acetyltransferase [Bifidobacteriaceae bacterium]
MKNSQVVRVADHEDHEDLEAMVALCIEARDAQKVPTSAEQRGRIARQVRAVLADPGTVCLLASTDDDAIGFALLRPLGPSPIYDLPRLQVEALYVRPHYRRQGFGRALIRAALFQAE